MKFAQPVPDDRSGFFEPAGPAGRPAEIGAMHDRSPRGGLPGRGQVDLLLVGDRRAGEQQRRRDTHREAQQPAFLADSLHWPSPLVHRLSDAIGVGAHGS